MGYDWLERRSFVCTNITINGILSSMILPLHIIIALSSLVLTFINVLRPTKARLHVAHTLIASTVLSGSLLILSTEVSLTRACVSGLIYIALAASGTLYSTRKLAFVRVASKNDHVRD